MKINNIRILFHINKLAKDLLNIVNDYPYEVKHAALHTLVLFTSAFYSNNSDFPEFNALRNINYTSFIPSDTNENLIQDWKNTLQAYGYQKTDNFDLVIHDGVNHGYFDELKLIEESKVLAEQVNLNKSEESIRKAWDLYHNGFDTNESDLIRALDESVSKYYNNISPNNLNTTIAVLRVLNKHDLADELIDFYIEKRQAESRLFDLSKNSIVMSNGISFDQMLVDKFNEIYQSTIKRKSLKEVLEGIVTTSSWSEEDKKVFEDATTDDLYKLFKSQHDDKVISLIKASFCVIPEKTKEALKIIGNESPLNAFKVRQFGIISEKN